MPRRRLTDDERSIRRSRGISIIRVLPFLLMFITVIVMSTDNQIFQQCTGRPLDEHGRAAAWVRFLASIPCSPYYLSDFANHWLNIAVFFVSAGFAIPQIFWMRRHEVYWNSVREREKAKRAEKSVGKNADLKTESDSVTGHD